MDHVAIGVAVAEAQDILELAPTLQVVNQLDQALLALLADHVVTEVQCFVGQEAHMRPAHDHGNARIPGPLRVAIGAYGCGGGR